MKYGVVFPQTEFGNDVQAIKDYTQTDVIRSFKEVLG